MHWHKCYRGLQNYHCVRCTIITIVEGVHNCCSSRGVHNHCGGCTYLSVCVCVCVWGGGYRLPFAVASVMREKYFPLNLLCSIRAVRGFYSGLNLAYTILTPQAKPAHARTTPLTQNKHRIFFFSSV